MFKKIKQYFFRKRMQRLAQIEMLETLATICLYLEKTGLREHIRESELMRSHFHELKSISCALRMSETPKNNKNNFFNF